MRKYYLTVIPTPKPPEGIPVGELEVGELAEGLGYENVVEKGCILLRTYNGVVSLTDPNRTWTWERETDSMQPHFRVKRLSPGTIVRLVAHNLLI